MKTGSLVAFTLLLQAAAGSFWVFQLLGFTDPVLFSRLWPAGLAAIAGMAAAGLLASFFHLGSPQRAFLAVSHLNSSWLSREIAFALLFSACLLVLLLENFWRLPAWLAGSAGLVGLLAAATLIFSMSKIYMLKTIPAWNSFATLTAFSCAAVLLGCGLSLAVIGFAPNGTFGQAGVAMVGWLMLAAAGLDLLAAARLQRQRPLQAANGAIRSEARANPRLFLFYSGLLVLGLMLFWALVDGRLSGSIPNALLASLAYLVLWAAAVANRRAFFEFLPDDGRR